eukprot:8030281-Alexandrium_andersonii.AAC.1
MCIEAKRAVDNIYGLASRQGKLDWFHEQKGDDRKLQFMVKHYKDQMKLYKGNEGPKWSIAMCKEAYQTATEVMVTDKGEMMGEELFIEHAQTARMQPARLTMKQAKA